MTDRRIFIHSGEIVSDHVVLSRTTARYVAKVLRYRQGDLLKAFDGRREYLVRLVKCSQTEVSGRILESTEMEQRGGPEIVLGFCCVRPGPLEEILRHGTELGVSRFVPLLSQRSNRKPKGKKERWQTIVAAASAQSGRSELPVVEPPAQFHEFIERMSGAETRILLSTVSAAPPLLSVLDATRPRRVVLTVGPEGGFEPTEQAQAAEAGFHPATLCEAVLRTETAAIVATGIAVAWYQSRHRNDPISTDSPGCFEWRGEEPVS